MGTYIGGPILEHIYVSMCKVKPLAMGFYQNKGPLDVVK
jgi:hypothetical protein